VHPKPLCKPPENGILLNLKCPRVSQWEEMSLSTTIDKKQQQCSSADQLSALKIASTIIKQIIQHEQLKSKPQSSPINPDSTAALPVLTKQAPSFFQGEQTTSISKPIAELDNELGTNQGKSKIKGHRPNHEPRLTSNYQNLT